MAKPWARLEQNFINHQKFLALTSNAICLWLEGKNYCDMYQTDGLIPKTALPTFRFNSGKCRDLLGRSCGNKPNGKPFAPLWEAIDIGGVAYYRMHDYLDHNDCRDAVLERLTDAEDRAELRRLKNAERMRSARAERKAELHRARTRAQDVCARAQNTSPPTETETETLVKEERTRERKEPASLSPAAPTFQDARRDPFTNPDITQRAGAFVERYQELYPKHRAGAFYAVHPVRDYAAAVRLCQTWPDDRLDKLAVIFLTTDHKFAEEGSRTIPQFLALASWCDGKLAAHLAAKGA